MASELPAQEVDLTTRVALDLFLRHKQRNQINWVTPENVLEYWEQATSAAQRAHWRKIANDVLSIPSIKELIPS